MRTLVACYAFIQAAYLIVYPSLVLAFLPVPVLFFALVLRVETETQDLPALDKRPSDVI